MKELIQKITDNLERECEKNTSDMTCRVVCNHVAELLPFQPQAVLTKIAEGKLSIAGAVKRMRDEAKKTAVGGCGVLTDAEGFGIIDKYFGLKPEEQKAETASIFDLI